MSNVWDESRINKYILDEIQESLTLDYKAADALSKADAKKTEITKDVSAMANSAGGIIIYGIREHQQPDKKHLPEKIDPVDQTLFSREWLEQVISNIRPKIDGLIIYPVPISSGINHVVYVVEVSQGSTAHQATDKRYYKRYNFLSVPMDDYEIRDVMSRQQHPKFDLHFYIKAETEYDSGIFRESTPHTACTLQIQATNIGGVFAQYVNCFIDLPTPLLDDDARLGMEARGEKIEEFYQYYEDNTTRDVIDVQIGITGPINKYGPARFDPILPGLSHNWSISISRRFFEINLDELEILWSIHADNTPPAKGKVAVKDISVADLRKEKSQE